MENKRNLKCKKGMETKITHFCLQTRGLIRFGRKRKKKKKRKEGGAKQRYGS